MAEDQVSDDPSRQFAHEVLRLRPWDSVVDGLKVGGGALTLCGALGTGLAALGQFDLVTLQALSGAVATSVLAGFLAFEFKRLAECRRALRQLLRSERVYEDLLRDARQQRDLAIAAKNEALVTATAQTEVVRAFAAVSQLRIQPGEFDADSNNDVPAGSGQTTRKR